MKSITQCLLAQKKAKNLIAGVNHLLSKRSDQYSQGVWPSYFSRAKGVNVWDLDGNKYVDMSIGGIGATVLGYADIDVDNAVKKSIDGGIASSLNAVEDIELAELLCQLHPWAQKARFTRTGGEAMTVAIRIARAATNKDVIIFCGYHGWHDWYLAANINDQNNLKGHLLAGLSANGVPKALRNTAIPFKYNDLTDLDRVIFENEGNIAAIVMEPIRNIWPTNNYLQKVRARATQVGVPLIFDEISSGFRLSSAGAHLLFDVEPDIAVFSKAIGNGYPIGAIIGTNQYMDAINRSFISSTSWTERTGTTAAIATIKKHCKLNVGQHLIEIGTLVQNGWKTISIELNIPLSIGGIYPLSHFEFEIEGVEHLELKAYYIQEMLKLGFLASNIFYAMYAHTPAHVKSYLEATKQVFTNIKEIIISDQTISDYLIGEPSVAGFKRMT